MTIVVTGRSLVAQAAWAFNGQVAQSVLGFAGILVMGRILGPEAYGVFTMALLVVGLAEIIVGGHMTDFLVQKDGAGRADSNAAFLLVVGVAVVVAVGLAAAAPYVSAAISTPEVEVMMPAVGLLIVLTAFAGVPVNLLVRSMRFDLLARVDTAAAAGAFVAGVSFAMAGAGVWSLVVMEIVRRSLRCVLAAVAARWRPGLATSRIHFGELWVFARTRLLGTTFQYVAGAAPRFIIGTMLGAQAVGYYAVANRIVEQMSNLITGPLSAVAFPATARTRSDPERIRMLLGRAITISTAVAWPAILGFVVIAPLVVPLTLGSEWVGAVLVFQILMLRALRAPITGFNTAIMLGMGRPDLRMRVQRLNAVLSLTLCPIGAFLWGLEGVAVALVIRSVVTWPVTARYVSMLIDMATSRQIRIALVASVPALVMAGATEMLRREIGGAMSPVAATAVLIAFGVVAYALIWAVFNARQVHRQVPVVLRRARRQPESPLSEAP